MPSAPLVRNSHLLGVAPVAEFEYQEMRALLEAMQRQGITSRFLDPAKRIEIEQYVRTIATERAPPFDLKELGQILPQSKWRLAFSTDNAVLGDLPAGAVVVLDFLDERRVDYVLEFSEKTFGLNRLVAKSSYFVNTDENTAGEVSFVYEEIVSDLFGFTNVGVGFFGLLKGRTNYIKTAFVDGRFWIERGYSTEGQEYFNVYGRVSDTELSS